MVHLFNPLLHVPFLSFCSPLLRPNRHIHVHTNTHHTEGAQQLKWAEIKETLGISNGSKWPYSGDSVESTSIHYLCICFYLTLHEHVLGHTHTRAAQTQTHRQVHTHSKVSHTCCRSSGISNPPPLLHSHFLLPRFLLRPVSWREDRYRAAAGRGCRFGPKRNTLSCSKQEMSS